MVLLVDCGNCKAIALFAAVEGCCRVLYLLLYLLLYLFVAVVLIISYQTVSVSKFQGQRLEVSQILNWASFGRSAIRVES